MNKLENLKQLLAGKFKIENFKFTHAVGDDVIEVPKEDAPALLLFLRESGQFDFLMDVCGADYPSREKRFDVVYNLFNSKDSSRLRVKAQVGEGESIGTAIPAYRGADWFEREAYDMFGIIFEGHPNLRKILTHHQFVGHPLRKDYDANNQQACTNSLPIHFNNEPGSPGDVLNDKYLPLNIGPSHTAMHGTLRVMAEMDGETIVRCNNEIGYLHRCFEKMAETHPYNQVIPYTDRLNYCSAPMNNIGYCKAVERLLGVEIPPKAQAMRVILAELSRIIDHTIAIGTGAMDLGALTSFFYMFGMREKVYGLFEKLCGARLTVSMTRIGGMAQDAPEGWFDEVLALVKEIRKGTDEMANMVIDNKIFIQRTKNVCPVSAADAIQWGYTGPMLRACGVNLDLRKAQPYYGYDALDFDVPVGTNGDIYDRYLVRFEEMRQSVRIIEQVCKNVPGGDYTIRDKGIVLPEKKDVYGNIEGLMNHFMLIIKGLRPPVGEVYDATEAANGELGFYLVSDGSANPYRLKVRPPCFAIYQSFPTVVKGAMLADAIATVASMNLIAGELDR
ncbi:NADH dehydrogenase (quinone) subunit D [Bdellovibrio bacteriovorus]|uniref:NADH-quinone oxidoreductase subunit C/D n=1 Tax=Bdellovibrio bacteriovorus (strain ATCC 15356 / DSM 50701 / NCIMB 9529 / HD100) TaxID=264462 RepID=NUOCD_BDEBA|nr:NADH dehydrogenase (quinone) subunit D [Bdellovibrio bacteriovorus]Q6MIR5.1 RecName: Full=NADH-quinone oxidoreductase subunit C/D; AltName: Full=NADH dehydrogenase I subunit C/D; AltName: Full=NDH-1 subunit C/D; AltName: Full=NUO3/NUO4 [Bdellovibrio bacteriovorus HD100]AHZ83476.1 NADH-quinone oxidoreductase subunit C [Bdellovibrio bacteriovorus]BEV69446.1 NADH-quinone oxidoreductase subunit C/D [Bdellovibrio bacteriovorus]CAE80848.1 NADH dehydrogenase I,D subunit [Bdellovibrio bacteriovorus 